MEGGLITGMVAVTSVVSTGFGVTTGFVSVSVDVDGDDKDDDPETDLRLGGAVSGAAIRSSAAKISTNTFFDFLGFPVVVEEVVLLFGLLTVVSSSSFVE